MKSRHIRKWEGDAREAVDGGPGRGSWRWTAERQLALDSREAVGAGQQSGEQQRVGVGQQRGEQQRVSEEPRTGAVNTGHRSREARQHGIGSSDSESR